MVLLCPLGSKLRPMHACGFVKKKTVFFFFFGIENSIINSRLMSQTNYNFHRTSHASDDNIFYYGYVVIIRRMNMITL